jgi:hypothetical protein
LLADNRQKLSEFMLAAGGRVLVYVGSVSVVWIFIFSLGAKALELAKPPHSMSAGSSWRVHTCRWMTGRIFDVGLLNGEPTLENSAKGCWRRYGGAGRRA